jgi:beta-1,4-mannosyl-glycoprotein beta-1,4-N-acetylglucosaminyltransferase
MKIIDSFLFFNELDILSIRLNEMYDQVDFFILLESTKTFQLKDKPLIYLENKHLFKDFEKKIIHYIYDPEILHTEYFLMENNQRKALRTPIDSIIEKDDYILMSDVDEIIKSNVLKQIRNNPPVTPKVFVQSLSYNFINTIVEEPLDHKNWKGSVIIPYIEYVNNNNLQAWRDIKDTLPIIENAGWHFSFMGGKEMIKTKIESYSHTEYNNSLYTDLFKIEDRMKSLKDPLNRNNFKLRLEKNLHNFPISSLKFQHLFYNL